MTIEFIQTCETPSPLLSHYEEAKATIAGAKIKQAIISAGFFTRFDLFKDYAVKVEVIKYQNEDYAVVTHSAINHIFKMTE